MLVSGVVLPKRFRNACHASLALILSLPYPSCTRGGNVTWFKLNVGQYGFYRVNYAIDGMYTQLAAATR